MAKHKILVVDDEESLCEILQFNLEVEGYEADVYTASDRPPDASQTLVCRSCWTL